MSEPSSTEQPPENDPKSEQHEHAPEILVPDTADVRAEAVLLERAIGGWRGMIDSGVPTVVFVIAYVITGQQLTPSVIAAMIAGLLIVVLRVVRREPLGQVAAGFAGVAISAAFAHFSGRAENYFLPGFLQNVGYGSAFLISILVGWPLLGVVLGYLTGDGTAWRADRQLRRVYSAASWIWVALFLGRLAVQVPMYLVGAITLLGITKIVMGVPLYVAAAYFTYRLLQPVWVARRAAHGME